MPAAPQSEVPVPSDQCLWQLDPVSCLPRKRGVTHAATKPTRRQMEPDSHARLKKLTFPDGLQWKGDQQEMPRDDASQRIAAGKIGYR